MSTESRKKVVAFIPIKSVSKRVPGKNFRVFAGNPLYSYIISAAIQAECFDAVYVDTDSDEIKQYADSLGAKIIDRPAYMTADSVNGNDLIVYDASVVAEGEILVQLFATAPLLSPDTIKKSVDVLRNRRGYDSVFTVTEERGWYWYQNQPVNYRPSVLPRSQDAVPMMKESTGLYGIYRNTLEQYKERIGARPYMYIIPPEEALDIDTEFDFQYAEEFAQTQGVSEKVLRTAHTRVSA